MPQLDFNNVLTLSQVVWMAFIFGALYFLLSTWALPQVAGVLEEREARISSDLDAARLSKAEADSAAAEVQAATRRASTDAQGAIAAAMAEAKARAAEQAQAANERLDEQLAQAERRIGEARSAAMGTLREIATETAEVVVTRLTGQAADPAQVSGAVQSVMAGRG